MPSPLPMCSLLVCPTHYPQIPKGHCQANVAHVRQSRPVSGLDFHAARFQDAGLQLVGFRVSGLRLTHSRCHSTAVQVSVLLTRCAALGRRCPPRQKSRVEPLKAKVEPLLTEVTVETSEPGTPGALNHEYKLKATFGRVLSSNTTTSKRCAEVPRRAHRLLNHSTLGLRVVKRREVPSSTAGCTAGWEACSGCSCHNIKVR